MEIKSLEIESIKIPYKLIKSTRASRLKLQIVPGGELELIVPNSLDLKIAQNFIEGNKNWIKKNIHRLTPNKYFYLGHEIFIHHQIDMFSKIPTLRAEKEYLIVSANADYEFFPKEIYKHWLKTKAKIYIPKRIDYFAKNYDFAYNRVSIRGQRTRWGSCSTKKNLNFNYYLMKHNKKIIDYVIVHELCHLKQMNHSKKFWSLVEEIIPDYKKQRRRLKGFH